VGPSGWVLEHISCVCIEFNVNRQRSDMTFVLRPAVKSRCDLKWESESIEECMPEFQTSDVYIFTTVRHQNLFLNIFCITFKQKDVVCISAVGLDLLVK
jgi:hypothetical protein